MNADGWTTCLAGHRHWGRAGAAGLLVHRPGARGLELLLQQRHRHSHHGGTWGPPGGALGYGEDPVVGALREAREELGLRSADVVLGNSYTDDHGGWSYVTVLAQPIGSLVPADLTPNWESTAVAWVPVADLGVTVPPHPGFAATLPALLNLMRDTELAELHSALFGHHRSFDGPMQSHGGN